MPSTPATGDRAEAARPSQERLEASDGGLEAGLSEVAAQWVDHRRDMAVGVGVDPKGHLEDVDVAGGLCDDGHRCPLVVLERVGSTCRQSVDKTVMGA